MARSSRNTIASTAAVSHCLLRYFGPNTVNDLVIANTFLGNPGFAGQALFLADAIGTDGLTVTDNVFRDADSNQVAIAAGINTQNLTLARNVITLTGAKVD